MARENWNHGTCKYGRFRGGKTKLERSNGTWAQRFANRAARVAEQQARK